MSEQTNESTPTREEMMSALIAQISAYIEQYHGGSVELISFEEDTATVRMGGACIGCPLSPSTLRGWVEGTVHQFFPEVTVIEAE
jgi:Fe-S cluster biogenesis protein NfuA